MAGLSTQSAKSPLSERGDDLYETPPEATRALLACETLPRSIWEPACGPGAIARVLREAGHDVFASDLVDYETPEQDEARRDFLLPSDYHFPCDAIVTNPPYKLADTFARRAIDAAPKVCLLLRLAFLESKSRTDILEGGHLARIHVFRERLTMHRGGWDGPKVGGAIPFAWFVWDRHHVGAPVLNRISWREFAE